jgi:toxin-antitoxin system PIN domain toxin
MFVVDTNVLIDAANRLSEFHDPCRKAIERFRTQTPPWYVSWPICYEFLRVCTHPNILPKPWSLGESCRFLQTLLNAPAAGVLLAGNRHAEVLGEVVAEIRHLRGNILHDTHTAVLMREHGIRQIYTRDTDFHRFPFLTVIDPTT